MESSQELMNDQRKSFISKMTAEVRERELHVILLLSNGPAKKQAIASVIFQVLISLIKLNLNALIGQCSKKQEI